MRRTGQPSWLSMPLCGRSPRGQGPGYSSLTRPTSGRTRSCGGSGCSRENLPGGVHQSQLREKASYYSAVCLETGEVEWMELGGNSNSGTSVAFLKQLKEKHPGPLKVIWDNAPAHRGEAMREYLRTPNLKLQLVNLPGYSPDFNADEAIWGWAREEATGNLCLGSREAAQERVGRFLAGIDPPERRGETALPDDPPVKGRGNPVRLPA